MESDCIVCVCVCVCVRARARARMQMNARVGVKSPVLNQTVRFLLQVFATLFWGKCAPKNLKLKTWQLKFR